MENIDTTIVDGINLGPLDLKKDVIWQQPPVTENIMCNLKLNVGDVVKLKNW